jgi:hypothetical protein
MRALSPARTGTDLDDAGSPVRIGAGAALLVVPGIGADALNPTPLMPGAGKDLLDGLPEAERTVADREVGRDLESTSLDVDQELAPPRC